ncbi:hypothetical protein ALNOE001_16790 [Candidatus Methanobinarius endosymbioticus]|uniref:Right handed beta helix domain-containing protein n=1 Tax=Candidatus Methanobinarius endosymbioticus TaxID=2006182 RepID=A0A366MAU2_9EURY|nr:hypothetical protein ALNOE001_16790 [Candidatus Methanobinarius endosymbioticus]
MKNINITRNLTIRGNSATVSAFSGDTLFNLRSGQVVIENLTISGFNTAISSNVGTVVI